MAPWDDWDLITNCRIGISLNKRSHVKMYTDWQQCQFDNSWLDPNHPMGPWLIPIVLSPISPMSLNAWTVHEKHRIENGWNWNRLTEHSRLYVGKARNHKMEAWKIINQLKPVSLSGKHFICSFAPIPRRARTLLEAEAYKKSKNQKSITLFDLQCKNVSQKKNKRTRENDDWRVRWQEGIIHRFITSWHRLFDWITADGTLSLRKLNNILGKWIKWQCQWTKFSGLGIF